MKKILLSMLAITVSTVLLAQNKPSIEIKGGLSNATINGDAAKSLQGLIDYANGAITTHSNTGLFAGASVSFPLNEMFSISPSLLYTQKGYTLRGELNVKGMEFIGMNAKASLISHYIDLPVVLKATIDGFQIFAGPQVSYLAKADLKTSAGALGINFFSKKMDATDQFNNIDAGVTGGVGYSFSNGFTVSAAYDHGLTKIDANRNTDAYNRAFKVGIGFKF